MSKSPIPLFKVFMPETAHSALGSVLKSGRLAIGARVAEFELELAKWLRVPRCTALNDASGALMIALHLAGVRPGDEVITSPMACSASLMPIANLFAKPVWCDIDPLTGMMDCRQLSGLISEKTRALMFYHWSGNVGEVESVAALAKQKGIKLIQDATEAFGAQIRGNRLGGEADYTVYSFYATKHINCGEGAALLTADPADSEQAILLRRFGIDYSRLRRPNGDLNPDFDIPAAGYNLAMNEIAATIGREALSTADAIVSRHQANGEFYDAALAGISGLSLMTQRSDARSAYWTYSILVERREDLIRKLGANGIGAQRLHVRNDDYSCFGGRQRELAGVSAFDSMNLSIPCGWWVDDEDRQRIAEIIRAGW